MFYKPHYCSDCGEKIERTQWFPWTSRRFCEVCETDLKFHELFPKIVIGLSLLVGLLGIGSLMIGSEKEPLVAVNHKPANPASSKKISENQTAAKNVHAANAEDRTAGLVDRDRISPAENHLSAPGKPIASQKTIDQQPVDNTYFCGAQTKKGTPCSRRVKGGGRCWQHKGQTALLPDEKLLVRQ